MGQASDTNAGRVESPREGRDKVGEDVRRAAKLHGDTGSPGEQREVRTGEAKRQLASLEKTGQFPPADQLLPESPAVAADGRTGASGFDEVKETKIANAKLITDTPTHLNDNDRNKDFSEKKAEAQSERQKPPDQQLSEERENLKKLADTLIKSPEERKKFQDDMEGLEKRLSSMEDRFRRQGKSPEEAHELAQREVAKTFHETGRILECAKELYRPPLLPKEYVNLAEQVMEHAHNPTGIDQGSHSTCTVNSGVESRIFERNPAVMANFIANLAINGQHTAKDGTVVKIDDGSRRPQDEAMTHPVKDGERDLSSQIAQVGLVNLHYAKNKSHIHYEQDPTDYSKNPPESGERLMDYSKNPPEKIGQAPGLTDSQVVALSNSLTGDKSGKWFIHQSPVPDKDPGAASVDGTPRSVNSAKAFDIAVKTAIARGEEPLVLSVYTGHPPYPKDSGRESAAPTGKGGWHVVGAQPDIRSGEVDKLGINNSWGEKSDHLKPGETKPISEVWKTMQPPPT